MCVFMYVGTHTWGCVRDCLFCSVRSYDCVCMGVHELAHVNLQLCLSPGAQPFMHACTHRHVGVVMHSYVCAFISGKPP